MTVYMIDTSMCEPPEELFDALWEPPILYSTREKAVAAADEYHADFPDDPRPEVIAVEVQ